MSSIVYVYNQDGDNFDERLTAAITAVTAGSSKGIVVIDRTDSPYTYSGATPITVPPEVTLVFQDGVIDLTSATGDLTIQGPIVSPGKQIFSNTLPTSYSEGRVMLRDEEDDDICNRYLSEINPLWFGDDADDLSDSITKAYYAGGKYARLRHTPERQSAATEIDIEDYGGYGYDSKPEGTPVYNDDAFAAAIAAIATNDRGGVIKLKNRIYFISEAIVIEECRGLEICGPGGIVHNDLDVVGTPTGAGMATIWQTSATAHAIEFTRNTGGENTRAALTLRNLTINGIWERDTDVVDAYAGLYIDTETYSAYVRIYNCLFTHFSYGIKSYYDGARYGVQEFYINDSVAKLCHYGLYLDGTSSGSNLVCIKNCDFRANGKYAVAEEDYTTITQGCGIHLRTACAVSIIGCNMEANSTGLHLYNVDGGVIEGNYFESNATCAVNMEICTNLCIRGNHTYDPSIWRIKDCNHIDCSLNDNQNGDRTFVYEGTNSAIKTCLQNGSMATYVGENKGLFYVAATLPTAPFTMACWMNKIANVSGSYNYLFGYGKSGTGGELYYCGLATNGDDLISAVRNNGDDDYETWADSLTYSTWHHLTLVINSFAEGENPGDIDLWLDGVLVATETEATQPGSIDRIYIGGMTMNPYCKCYVAHAAVYSKALSEAEIIDLQHFSPLLVARSSLVRYHSFAHGANNLNDIGTDLTPSTYVEQTTSSPLILDIT